MGAGSRSSSVHKGAVALVLVFAAACSSRQDALPTAALAPARTATLAPAPTASPVPSASPTPLAAALDVDAVMDHVRALAVEIGLRNSGSDGDEKASKYIAERISSMGWKAERRAFPLPQGGESWNVVGTPPGFDERKSYLIVGGHYDSLNGPGANDNATGVGIALEIARMVAEGPGQLPMVFVAFGAEERQPHPDRPHHIGSVQYVSKMSSAARKNLVAFVNIDMVGHGAEIICGRISTGPHEGTDRCVRVGKELAIAVRERVTPDWSDHGSFAKQGMNTAWLWTGEVPCCYHNPKDTIDIVRTADVERSGRLALAMVRSYSG